MNLFDAFRRQEAGKLKELDAPANGAVRPKEKAQKGKKATAPPGGGGGRGGGKKAKDNANDTAGFERSVVSPAGLTFLVPGPSARPQESRGFLNPPSLPSPPPSGRVLWRSCAD